MPRLLNLNPKSLLRRNQRDQLRFQAEKMKLGRLATQCGARAESLHEALLASIAKGDLEGVQTFGPEASRALNDWARICQIPLPPRPKDGNRPMIDVNLIADIGSDEDLVASLRRKPKAEPVASPTPEPASPPAIDVDQAINPG